MGITGAHEANEYMGRACRGEWTLDL